MLRYLSLLGAVSEKPFAWTVLNSRNQSNSARVCKNLTCKYGETCKKKQNFVKIRVYKNVARQVTSQVI